MTSFKVIDGAGKGSAPNGPDERLPIIHQPEDEFPECNFSGIDHLLDYLKRSNRLQGDEPIQMEHLLRPVRAVVKEIYPPLLNRYWKNVRNEGPELKKLAERKELWVKAEYRENQLIPGLSLKAALNFLYERPFVHLPGMTPAQRWEWIQVNLSRYFLGAYFFLILNFYRLQYEYNKKIQAIAEEELGQGQPTE